MKQKPAFTKPQLTLILDLVRAEMKVIELVRPDWRTKYNVEKMATLQNIRGVVLLLDREVYEKAEDALDTNED